MLSRFVPLQERCRNVRGIPGTITQELRRANIQRVFTQRRSSTGWTPRSPRAADWVEVPAAL